jgi:5-methylcytosine-specific restriction endonuclease McrA
VRELGQPVLFEELMLRQGRPKAMLPTASCATCGKAIPPRWGAHYKNKAPKFCSRVCAGRGQHPPKVVRELPVPRTCAICGELVSRNRLSCPGACHDLWIRLKSHEYWLQKSTCDRSARPCQSCGLSFVPKHGNQRAFCSDTCSAREGKNRRRAAKAAVPHERIRRLHVFDRDGWRCQLCGRRTKHQYLGLSHPLAPTLDHIVPIARGGSHTYANVQCACFACNSRKNARVFGQMRII